MALIDQIRMPGTGFEGLIQGSDWMNKLLMAPVERRYKEAEEEKARAQAQKEQMTANIFSSLMGGQPMNGQPGTNVGGQQSGMPGGLGISKEEVIRGLLGLGAESPQQREEREVREAQKKEQQSTDISSAKELEPAARQINETLNDIRRAKEILKRRKKGVTGISTGLLSKARLLTDEDASQLKDIFGKLQTAKAKIASQRGGAQIMNMVREFKPDIMNTPESNLAMLQSMEDDYSSQFKNLKGSYTKKTGKKLEDELGLGDSEIHNDPLGWR